MGMIILHSNLFFPTKILLMLTKCKIIMMLSNYSFSILQFMPILEIMRIFTCFILRYIKPIIDNRYLILVFAFNFFSQYQIRLKILCQTNKGQIFKFKIKQKMRNNSFKFSYFSLFSSKVTFRRIKTLNYKTFVNIA